jgi:hypothetical protein
MDTFIGLVDAIPDNRQPCRYRSYYITDAGTGNWECYCQKEGYCHNRINKRDANDNIISLCRA